MSNAHKTSYIKKLLVQAYLVFSEAPTRIIYYYNVFQPKFMELERSIDHISFIQGLPQRSDIEEAAREQQHLLLIFIDLYQGVISSRDITDLTIMLCHHLNISCIFTSHTIFTCGKVSKTIATNLHYILLFTLRNRLRLATLATQLSAMPNNLRALCKFMTISFARTPFLPC